MFDTLDYLRSISIPTYDLDTDSDLRLNCTTTAVTIGTSAGHATRQIAPGYSISGGYDAVHGGVFEWGTPTALVGTSKVWWIQAEAMLAFWKLHRFYKALGSPLAQEYLKKLVETTGFVRAHLVDPAAGEQSWLVRPLGLGPGLALPTGVSTDSSKHVGSAASDRSSVATGLCLSQLPLPACRIGRASS